MVRASCSGGPSTKPKVDLYESAKKPISVESMWRRAVVGAGSGPSIGADGEFGDSNLVRMGRVTIAVWVTLSGTIVFLIGTSRTICAASARINNSESDGMYR